MIDPANPDFANTPVAEQRPHFDYTPGGGDNAPAVSIVTPFYNTGAIFHETAASVLQQSMQQFEWIIVNDGSTDPEALAILDAYRQRDPRIRIIDHAANKGLPAARNTGYNAARSDFVYQLDSDDLLEPTAAEKCFWFLTSYPEYGFAEGHTVIFGSRNRLRFRSFELEAHILKGNCVGVTAMVRRHVHQQVSGFDETIREGLEDWEFWLRCANAGFWGRAIPEYLDWHRRRPDPTDRWPNLRSNERSAAMHRLMRQRYARLWEQDVFPRITPQPQPPFAVIPDELPCTNMLRKAKPRLLLIARCLTLGGGSKFKLDMVEQFVKRGWEITIAVTDRDDNPWLARFAHFTPDIFILPNMLRPVDFPRFLRYLAQSRQVDAIFLTGSETGYQLTPYLRAHFPATPLVDYCHVEEPKRNNGGFPRLSIMYKDMLQASAVSSHHLKEWMVERGADPAKVSVHYTSIDTDAWQPDATTRQRTRAEMGITDARPVLLFIGRMIPEKQPHVLARTALQLSRQRQPFVMLVGGSGPELPWLRNFVRKHRLQAQVRLLGAVPPQRVKQLLAAGDIFLLPSQSEGIALALYEAMACGLAIVAADVGGQSELVSADCGVLVPHRSADEDVQSYTQVLGELLAQPERWRALGAASRARVQAHFRLDQMAEGLISLINEARARCAEPASRPDIGVGRASATLAIEYMRLARAWTDCASGTQARHTGRVARAMARAASWAKYPPARVAPFVKLVKRMTPDAVKIAIKKRLL